jgi:hypothetical protein
LVEAVFINGIFGVVFLPPDLDSEDIWIGIPRSEHELVRLPIGTDLSVDYSRRHLHW